jgi:uncharacterized protein (DUF1778 family)
MPTQRTALLIRCSHEEAETIRAAAKAERRTLSGYVLNAVMNRIANQQSARLRVQLRPVRGKNSPMRQQVAR